MKRILMALCLLAVVTACKKTEIEPEGPTDVRVYNNTDQLFENVIVNTSGGEYNFGTVSPGTYTPYHRFDKAYPKADISLNIRSYTYSTLKQDYTYMQYMGRMKITYKVFISNESRRELDTQVVTESDL